MGFILFLIAYILFLPLSIINFFLVWNKGYFMSSAINLDKFANREFRTLWNRTLIIDDSVPFGDVNRTISAVLGENYLRKKLSTTGKILVFILTKKHCIHAFAQEIKNESKAVRKEN